jgi:hypothetical protein
MSSSTCTTLLRAYSEKSFLMQIKKRRSGTSHTIMADNRLAVEHTKLVRELAEQYAHSVSTEDDNAYLSTERVSGMSTPRKRFLRPIRTTLSRCARRSKRRGSRERRACGQMVVRRSESSLYVSISARLILEPTRNSRDLNAELLCRSN